MSRTKERDQGYYAPPVTEPVLTISFLGCAWCLREQGLPMGEGSHGICEEHAEQVREQAQERRRRKEAGL